MPLNGLTPIYRDRWGLFMSGPSSQLSPVKYGVPQGSVLGWLLFTLYIGELEDILVCISESNLDKLQHAQNCLAWMVTGAYCRDHIKPVLKNCTGFSFEQGSASRSRYLSAKSERATRHHTLQTSSMSTYCRGQFVPHQWQFLRNRQWGLQLATAVFITLLPRHGTIYHKLYSWLRHSIYLEGSVRNIYLNCRIVASRPLFCAHE